jgi:signal transduction histidine kinase
MGTFLGLLIFAMLLINLVIFVFWYQHVVQQKIQIVKNSVSVWQSLQLTQKYAAGNPDLKSSLQTLFSSLGPGCRQVLVIHEQQVITAVETHDRWGLEALVASVSISGKGTVQYIEKTEIPFFFTPLALAIALPINGSKSSCSGIGIALDTTHVLSKLWAKEKVILVYLFLNALILTIVGFFRMRRLVLAPIDNLVGVAENYHVSEGGGLFSENSENEFGQLSRAMNNMVQRIEEDRNKLCNSVDSLAETNLQLKNAQNEVVRAEKLAVAGRLSAALAHEIGNPVTIVQGYVELLKDAQLSENERSEFSGRALKELARIDRLIRQFLEVTHVREVKHEAFDSAELLRGVSRLLQTSLKNKNINALLAEPQEVALVWGDKEALRQVYLNCLINAMDAVVAKHNGATGGEIYTDITVEGTKNSEDAKRIVITIKDNGSGIKDENLQHIFEPFFTTKEPGKGTGLGLAISNRIIQSMGGQITAENLSTEGALFRITLPGIVKNSSGRK